jgi:hypothetical protein
MLFSYGVGDNESRAKKCRRITDNCDCHGDAAVQSRAHCPVEHIQGFTRSHWMPPLGECLHQIAPAAAMADELE